jgi:hypothetical protein
MSKGLFTGTCTKKTGIFAVIALTERTGMSELESTSLGISVKILRPE